MTAAGGAGLPRFYRELADWFHLLTAPEDYAEEAETYHGMLHGALGRPIRTLLELGSGGGNNASHYKHWVGKVTLTDISEGMLAVSRTINPECEHIRGDMRSLRLGRTFDAVFVHDAIVFLTTERDLAACLETAAAHLGPGGVALFVPDFTAETFQPQTDHGGHDSRDGSRGIRYVEWTRDDDPDDTTCQASYAYLLRDGRDVRAAFDAYDEGLFPAATWERLLRASGFDLVESRYMEWEGEVNTQVAFLARKR